MKEYPILRQLNGPKDLQALPEEKLPALAEEIRGYMVDCVSKNGGHLAASLGAVDLIIALHRVYTGEGDRLLFDVGHQAYAHKILTGRRDAFASLRSLDGAAFVRLGLAALGCLAIFSFLASTRDDPWADAPASPRSVNPVTLSTVLALLIAVYGLFVYVQFRYLFGGAETAKMAGGYAEYARSGFFQLVLLSALTLGLIMPFLQWGRDRWAVRLLCAVTILLTVVIVFSAFYRMRLYIWAYGLSILRIVTLWGMAMILLALTATLIKCIQPGLCVCPALAALALASWLALNLIGPETAVARNQVDLYNRGVITRLDAAYLSHLSPAAVKEMENIRDAAARDEALREAESYLRRAAPHAYDWSLPWLGVSADAQEH